MATSEEICDALCVNSLTQEESVILCLSLDGTEMTSCKDVRQQLVLLGVTSAKKWNLSTVLKRCGDSGSVIKAPGGYRLSSKGQARADSILGNPIVPSDVLRNSLNELPSSESKKYLDESITCLENHCLRGAIILSWIGAIAILYEYVLKTCLDDFNRTAHTRLRKWKDASTFDDLANLKERDFLEILGTLSIIGKSTKTELIHCLDTRNACGHPNTFNIGEAMTRAHIEVLARNIYSNKKLI